MKIEPNRLYTFAEVAKACKVHKATVYRWGYENKIQVIRSPYPMQGRGGKNLIQGSEFLELLKWRRQEERRDRAYNALRNKREEETSNEHSQLGKAEELYRPNEETD